MFWFENDVRALEKLAESEDSHHKDVFYGSSSICLWDTIHEDFPGAQILNLGFMGFTLAACVWFFHRIVLPFKPRSIVLYGGDNDLGEERHPEEVFIFFQQLVSLVRKHLGNIPIAFIAIKPSRVRWNINDRIIYTNNIIKKEIEKEGNHLFFIDIYSKMLNEHDYPDTECYLENGLHLSKKGYAQWKDEILKYAPLLFHNNKLK